MTIETSNIGKESAIGVTLGEKRIRALAMASHDAGLDELGPRASTAVAELIDIDPRDPMDRARALDAVDAIGWEARDSAAVQAQRLVGRLREHSLRSWRWPGSLLAIAGQSAWGGPVARSLAELRLEFEKLDPAWAIAATWAGTPAIEPYLVRLERSDDVIDAIIRSLGGGREQLKRDDVALLREQTSMAQFEYALADAVALTTAMEAAMGECLAKRGGPEGRRRRFIADELLVRLRRRTVDLREQRSVIAAAVGVAGSIVEHNRETIRRIDRAIDAATGARRMAELVDLDGLVAPFNDTLDGLDEIACFAADSVPRLARSILGLTQLMSGAGRSATTKVA